MEKCLLTIGDFLKNAGLVGMKYMLDLSEAREGIQYGITEDRQSLWVDREFAIQADWTSMYFAACVTRFGPICTYQRILDQIEQCREELESGAWKDDKNARDQLKFINDKLLSNSYKAGFANVREQIEMPEVYENLQQEKLNSKMESQILLERLKELDIFLRQPLCRETFVMKSAVYSYINRFWDGKCFLLRANAKKDMRELFEKDFSEPLRNHLSKSHDKAKDLCIDCGMPMENKEKVSIAFMRDVADDLSRKSSAFWNFKVDAFLCPVCAFVYALSPLGFQIFANKFVFVNINEDMETLLDVNQKGGKEEQDAEKKEDEKYSVWFARVMNAVLKSKEKELSNVQVVLRGMQQEDAYFCSIIGKDALRMIQQKQIRDGLEFLGRHPFVKTGGEYLNVHEQVVYNILQYRNQYRLLNRLLKGVLEQPGILAVAYWVYVIQFWMNRVRKQEKIGGNIFMSRIAIMNSGYDLRMAILRSKGTTDDACLRGTVYQLLNALTMKNESKFMNIVLRLYGSGKNNEQGKKLLAPQEFIWMFGDKEKFEEYGYIFVMGFAGNCRIGKKEEENG